MRFSLPASIEILEHTPVVVTTLLQGISDNWTSANEGPGTWSVYDILGHLIHGEKTDWIPRMEIILSGNPDKTFEPFDRFAQFEQGSQQTLQELLEDFKRLRQENIRCLRSKELTEDSLQKTGIHPGFGIVTLSQMLSAWTVHDLNHLAQIARVMAKQYKAEVGPWIEYLSILQR